MAVNQSMVVEVKLGEASESEDEEIPIPTSPRRAPLTPKAFERAMVVPGEASESEEEEIMNDGSPYLTSMMVKSSPSQEDAKAPSPQPSYHTSLLHKKLRERNALLRKRLVLMAQHPYVTAAKDTGAICQQLGKSQSVIQEVGPVMRQLTNNLFYLEDKLEISTYFAKLVPAIDIDISAKTAAAPSLPTL